MTDSPAVASSVLDTIARTPVVRLRRLVSAEHADVVVKLATVAIDTGLKYLAGDLYKNR
jgi:cysteine synthase